MPFKKSFKKRSSKFRSRIAPRRTRWRGKWRLRRGFDITKLSKNVVSVGTIRPDRIMVKLPYETTVQLTGAITVDHIMNTNSLFDPDRTGAGHQPMGFDTWSVIYNRYLVYGVSYDIEYVNTNATNVDFVGVVFSNDTTSLTASNCLEQSRGTNRLCGPVSSSKSVVSIKGYASNATITGVSKSKYNIDDTYGQLFVQQVHLKLF